MNRLKKSKVIGNRFVLRNKCGANGVLERRKARLVAKGYAQQYGKDFHETYAPIARLDSIRLTIALAMQSRMHIQTVRCGDSVLEAGRGCVHGSTRWRRS